MSRDGSPPGAERGLGRPTATSRVEAFSDGVMAIAITLLVLELKVPLESKPDHLLADLADRWPSYAAYIAAFLTIGIIWLNHHTLLTTIARFDTRLHWLNLFLLFTVATLPFPTALLADYIGEGGFNASIATASYGLLATMMSLPWSFMLRHLADHPDLVEPGYGPRDARAEIRRGGIGVPIYAVATLVSFIWPFVALGLYIAIAVLYAITSQGLPTRDAATPVPDEPTPGPDGPAP